MISTREGLTLTKAPTFDLWLEFEQCHFEQCHPDNVPTDPTEDFANVQVRLPDGRRYALNVWTFGFMRLARYPPYYEEDAGTPAEYLLPPDLFVERLDRPTLERVVCDMLAREEMRSEWLCPPEPPDN